MNRLILFFFLVAGVCVYPLKTTGQQIPVMPEMQEEINDIKQEIKELEEEIREVEKTDPEEAKMLKTQLSTMKSMLEMLDKTTKPATRTQNSPERRVK
jgi:flagellar capping protein FliD